MNTQLYVTMTYNRLITGVYTDPEKAIAAISDIPNSYVYEINANIQYDCIADIDKHGIEMDNSIKEYYMSKVK